MWNQALFQRNDEDDGEFKTFGSVQRHERQAVGVGVPGVDVGDERRFFQESFQTVLAAMLFVELAGGGQQFLDVGQPLLVVFVFGLFQERPVA